MREILNETRRTPAFGYALSCRLDWNCLSEAYHEADDRYDSASSQRLQTLKVEHRMLAIVAAHLG
jgi:hypothetical protein